MNDLIQNLLLSQQQTKDCCIAKQIKLGPIDFFHNDGSAVLSSEQVVLRLV